MNVVIYQSLIIHIFVLIYGVHTFSVAIEGSEVGLIGENGTEIECSYTPGNYILLSVSFLAFNKNSTTFETIATYIPNQSPKLNTNGQYLKGRVTLTPITQSSTKAVMIFNKLMCIDGTFYKCQVIYSESSGTKLPISNNISISVKVPPSKPDSVSLVHTPADSSVTTTKHLEYSTSLPSTAGTSNENNTVSDSKMENQNTTTAFDRSTIQTTGHNTKTSTPSPDNVSSNVSYKTTTYYIQQTTTEQVFIEGNNITVVCTGDVGNPPAEHFFQKNRYGHTKPVNYTASTTSKIEISDNCSYYRTSNLTFQVKAEDNNAVIRCVVNSSMAESDMYVETAQIEVYYEVSMPTIIIYPNKEYYVVGEDTSINLTCKSDGNPKPNYQWYKENHNESIGTRENLTIMDMNVTNSGIYTCTVNNTFNGYTYINATNVQIKIMNKADISTTQSSSTGSSSGADKKEEKSKGNLGLVIGIVVGVVIVIVFLIIIIAWRRRTSKSPTDNNESKGFVDPKSKPIAESRTGNYDDIALEEDTNNTHTVNNGLEVDDIREHNKEYSKKQEEEEQKKKETNTPPRPAVYAQVNEATKSKNKQSIETPEFTAKQGEDTYAETKEGIYDKAGDRRHKEKENAEHFDSSINASKQNSNGDNKLSIQTSQLGSYANQGFEKDENRKVATVSPTIRSSSGSQNDDQTNLNRNSQSKKVYENLIDTDQTGTSEEDSSHQTAL